MYAVIRDRGRQYTVRPGQTLRVDRLEQEPGAQVELGEVLLLGGEGGPRVGAPTVPGAVVRATVLGERKAAKLIVFKKKRRKMYRRKQGHRQRHTDVRVESIS